MKWLKEARDWLAFAFGVVGLIALTDQIAGWLSLYGWTWDFIREPLVHFLRFCWSIIFAASLVWTAYLAIRIMILIAGMISATLPFASIRIRELFGMAKIIKKTQAIHKIKNSDFYKMRLNINDESPISAFAAIRGFQSHRDRVFQERFALKMLAEFEGMGGDESEGYDSEMLDRWLDALVDKEIENEIGHIPAVFISKP